MSSEPESDAPQQIRTITGGQKAILMEMGVKQEILNALETEEDGKAYIEYMNSITDEKPPLALKGKKRNAGVTPVSQATKDKEAMSKTNSGPVIPTILNEYTKDEYLPEGMVFPGARVLRRETAIGRHIL